MRAVRLALVLLVSLGVAGATLIPFSNITNASGYVFSAGGAEVQGENTITRLIADDIEPVPGAEGLPVSQVSAVIHNSNSSEVTFRVLGRFWSDSVGGPGALEYADSFGIITLAADETRTITLSPVGFLLPSGLFYAGLVFDNAGGTTGAGAAELNALQLVLYDPPTIGASGDFFFRTTGAGDFAVNNPDGGFYWFSGEPVANFGWEFQVNDSGVPEPGTAGLLVLGLGALLYARNRRRPHS